MDQSTEGRVELRYGAFRANEGSYSASVSEIDTSHRTQKNNHYIIPRDPINPAAVHLKPHDPVPDALDLPVFVAGAHDGVRREEHEQAAGHHAAEVQQEVAQRVEVLGTGPGTRWGGRSQETI